MGVSDMGGEGPIEVPEARREWAERKLAELRIVGSALEEGLLTDQLQKTEMFGERVLYLSTLRLIRPFSWRLAPTLDGNGNPARSFNIADRAPTANMRSVYYYGEGAQLVSDISTGNVAISHPVHLEKIDDDRDIDYVDRAVEAATSFIERHVDRETLSALSAATA